MSDDEWKELASLGAQESKLLVGQYSKRHTELLEKTEHEECHPEWYDYGCWCLTCMSYGDS